MAPVSKLIKFIVDKHMPVCYAGKFQVKKESFFFLLKLDAR